MQEARVVKQSEKTLTLQVTIDLEGENFFAVEENILRVLWTMRQNHVFSTKNNLLRESA